jgi:RNA polymerase sigma-B factor
MEVAELAIAVDGACGGAVAAEATPSPDALALLPQLPPEQRLVVERVVLAGWSYRRVAAALQVSPMTVQRRLQRGLEQLRRRLQPSL